MNAREKFESLNEKSAWAYTKQKAEFKDLYKSAKLFSEIRDIENTNVEEYFAKHYKKYGISTNRHRILAIAQMFGLITKSNYYSRGGSTYSNESVTPVFEELKKYKVGSSEFNKIMSEQLIKIKVNSIIDTGDNHRDYKVFPFLFVFLVLWKLDKDYAIKLVPLNKLWTYVLTADSMNDISDAVKWIADPSAKISPFVNQYKSDSRFLTLFKDCTKMFTIGNDYISLNHPIANLFYENFVLKHSISSIESCLFNDEKYRSFLENCQGFDFDLTDNKSETGDQTFQRLKPLFVQSKGKIKSTVKDILVYVPDDVTYGFDNIVDSIIEAEEQSAVKYAMPYEKEEDIKNSNSRMPTLRSGLEKNNRYSTDPRLGKTAIKNAGYVCELSSKVGLNHETFSGSNGTVYLEAHHLIPMKAQRDFVSLGINLDRLENIVALCPNCHRAVHYGSDEEKARFLRPLYDARIKDLNKIGIDIDFDVLLKEYY